MSIYNLLIEQNQNTDQNKLLKINDLINTYIENLDIIPSNVLLRKEIELVNSHGRKPFKRILKKGKF